MWRPDNFLMAGVGLVIGLALAWVGASLTLDRAAANRDSLTPKQAAALIQEVEELRQDLKLLKQTPVNNRGPERIADTQAKWLDPSLPRPVGAEAETTKHPRGQITRIDHLDLTVVEVNLGKEAGLAKHDNLEIIRGSASPEHIGTLRILEVHDQRAVCRLLSTNPLKKQVPQVGDQVCTSRN